MRLELAREVLGKRGIQRRLLVVVGVCGMRRSRTMFGLLQASLDGSEVVVGRLRAHPRLRPLVTVNCVFGMG